MRTVWVALTCLIVLASLTRGPAHAWPRRDTFADAEHFSPAENLEQLDIEALDHARRTIDIAIYAFTDQYIARELIEVANRGVHIRLYRDREQWEQEQSRQNSTAEMLAGNANIEIRVKRSKTLMHLKTNFVDDALLRAGSANWSPTGLKRQDNNARYTPDQTAIQSFDRDFEEMWNRLGNEVIQ